MMCAAIEYIRSVFLAELTTDALSLNQQTLVLSYVDLLIVPFTFRPCSVFCTPVVAFCQAKKICLELLKKCSCVPCFASSQTTRQLSITPEAEHTADEPPRSNGTVPFANAFISHSWCSFYLFFHIADTDTETVVVLGLQLHAFLGQCAFMEGTGQNGALFLRERNCPKN